MYGDTYPDRDAYHTVALETRLEAGTQVSVGVWSNGRLVGHMAMWRRRRRSATVDAGFTMVDPEHRGTRISEPLSRSLRDEMVRAGLIGFHHYPVTVNTVTQRLGLGTGGLPCGVMLAHVSAEATRHSARSVTQGRSDALVLYQPLVPAPHRTLHVPLRDKDIVAGVVAAGALDRTISTTVATPTGRPSVVSVTADPSRDLLTMEVEVIGEDLAAACAQSSPLAHVDLSASDPAAAWAADVLRASGFVFAALLPEFIEGDVLRYQRLRADLGVVEPARLVSPECQRLHERIWADARESTARGDRR